MREWSYRRSDCHPTDAVREEVPTTAGARSEEHSDSCPQAARSQFRCIHGGWLAVCSQAVTPKCGILTGIIQVTNLTAVRAGSCRTAGARYRPYRHVDRISDRATADHGRGGLTQEASFGRPNPASRRVQSNQGACCGHASPPFPRNWWTVAPSQRR